MLGPLRRQVHLYEDLIEEDFQLARLRRHRRPRRPRLGRRVGPAHPETAIVEGAGAVDDAAVGARGPRHALLAAHRAALAVAVAGHAVDDLHGVLSPESGSEDE